MRASSLRTLLIEDNPADAREICEALAEAPHAPFEIDWVDRLAKGLAKAESESFDLVLLDLGLPESRGISTFTTMQAAAPEVPIIVLSGLDDEELALKAVRNGAQDYLVKGQVQGRSLVRAMQYAIVRNRMQRELGGPSYRDELTGLYNRQGFLVLGEQQMRLADLTKTRLALIVAEAEGLVKIGEAYGRDERKRALGEIAEVLRESFPQSDLVARLGPEEFGSIFVCTSNHQPHQSASTFEARLHSRNCRSDRPYQLVAGVGEAVYDPAHPCSLATLIARANAQAHLSDLAGEGKSKPPAASPRAPGEERSSSGPPVRGG
jgi:two-component system cell cycle response regulator